MAVSTTAIAVALRCHPAQIAVLPHQCCAIGCEKARIVLNVTPGAVAQVGACVVRGIEDANSASLPICQQQCCTGYADGEATAVALHIDSKGHVAAIRRHGEAAREVGRVEGLARDRDGAAAAAHVAEQFKGPCR